MQICEVIYISGINTLFSTNSNQSERLRNDAVRLMRETDEKTSQGQRDAGRRLGERITDVTFWRNELNTELDKLVSESAAISDLKRRCGKAMLDLEAPLHIAQECLYHREGRSGVEKVHDTAEKALLLEIDNIRNSRDKLKELHEKVNICHQLILNAKLNCKSTCRSQDKLMTAVPRSTYWRKMCRTKSQLWVLILFAIS